MLDLYGDEILYNPLENDKVFERHIADILKPHFREIKEQKYIDRHKS